VRQLTQHCELPQPPFGLSSSPLPFLYVELCCQLQFRTGSTIHELAPLRHVAQQRIEFDAPPWTTHPAVPLVGAPAVSSGLPAVPCPALVELWASLSGDDEHFVDTGLRHVYVWPTYIKVRRPGRSGSRKVTRRCTTQKEYAHPNDLCRVGCQPCNGGGRTQQLVRMKTLSLLPHILPRPRAACP